MVLAKLALSAPTEVKGRGDFKTVALSAPTELKGRSDFKTVALSAPTEAKGRGDFFRGSRATGIPWTSEWRSLLMS
jgi:hypothetical protein